MSATMEANLNQFRLLTVRGEQEANCRRGSMGAGLGRNRGFASDGASSLAGGDSGSNGSMNGSVCVSTTHDHDHGGRITDDSAPPSTRSSPPLQRHPTAKSGYSDDGDAEVSDDEDEDTTEVDGRKSGGDVEHSLISALRSLEQTLTSHTLLLTKRLRRELTVKGTGTDTTAAQLPAKTGQRGDKVELNHPRS